MTYQPYPTGGGANQTGTAERPPKPSTLRNAVRLIWAGGALSLIGVIITLSFSGRIKTAVTNAAIKSNKTATAAHKLTPAQIHSLANATVTLLAVFGVIGVLLWAWMAWANNRGSAWARIVATVLFGLNTIALFLELGRASVSLITVVLGWLIGLGAIVLLWNKQTSQYINAGRQR
jgi:ABC-type transport system involved in cytochrome bd biosynthesis fused ATPase/permease subunit